jgi:hypothetical protein
MITPYIDYARSRIIPGECVSDVPCMPVELGLVWSTQAKGIKIQNPASDHRGNMNKPFNDPHNGIRGAGSSQESNTSAEHREIKQPSISKFRTSSRNIILEA